MKDKSKVATKKDLSKMKKEIMKEDIKQDKKMKMAPKKKARRNPY